MKKKLPKFDSSFDLAIPIKLLDTTDLLPHPSNPRPWSEIYECNVHEDKVEELITVIQSSGFDHHEAIQVVPHEDKFRIVTGHHRWCAAKALGLEKVPCSVLDLTEIDAELMLVSRQGRAVDPWLLAKHAATMTANERITQTDYSQRTGYPVTLINKWVQAQRVRDFTGGMHIGLTAAATIARVDRVHWCRLVSAVELHGWSTRRVAEEVNAILHPPIDVSELPPAPTLPVASEGSGGSSLHMEQTLVIDKDRPAETRPIAELKPPTYPPLGLMEKVRTWGHMAYEGKFDAVILDRAELREAMFSALHVYTDVLKPEGRIVVVTHPRNTVDLQPSGDLVLEQKLVWIKGASSPEAQSRDREQGLFPSSYQDIVVLRKSPAKGTKSVPYCGLADINNLTPLDAMKILYNGEGLPALLAEILVKAYVPEGGTLLSPCAGDGSIALAGVRLSRRVVWLESRKAQFEALQEALGGNG